MTSSEITETAFARHAVDAWAGTDPRHRNWPVVYVIDEDARPSAAATTKVYVGESLNAFARMHQHLDSGTKAALRRVRVILDERFNKSVCLDLESHLIRWFSGDGAYEVLNLNGGITDARYYERDAYRERFPEIFEQLRRAGLFTRSIRQIENSDLFKLSPFKALTQDQAVAIEDILEGLFRNLEAGTPSTSVIQGDPGTGKTIVGIHLMKLLQDIAAATDDDLLDRDWMFSEFFADDYRELVQGLRIGLVIPQQSLRESIRKVFRRTPRLSASMVVDPFKVGLDDQEYDLLIVDETHRLAQRASLASGIQNGQFRDITVRLFGHDDLAKTQVDWIRARSRHQIFLLDGLQTVRPADLPRHVLAELVGTARREHRYYPLTSQMRVKAGEDYVGYVRAVLRGPQGEPVQPRRFDEYRLAMFDDLAQMREEIVRVDREHGLARLVAGYAWEWRSRKDPTAFDIELDGLRLQWNRADKDWINSPGSIDEVGSIHTVQGYDLNFAGVIIGNDLRLDPRTGRIAFHRASYFDSKGKQNNTKLGITYSDEDLLQYIVNIYGVLLTRGMLGTFVYVCDPALREFLRPHFGG